MTPLAKSQNLAARMGRWSAAHRKTAIFGWLAFVVVAVALGSVVGTKSLDAADAEAGDAGRALQIVDDGGFGDTVDESVFVENESLAASSPEFKAVVDDVVAELSVVDGVSRIRSPLDDPTLVSPDGRAVLVQYELTDEGTGAVERIDPILESVAAVEAANPGFTVDGFGSASGERMSETPSVAARRATTSSTTALNSGLDARSDSFSTNTDSSTVSPKPPSSTICSARPASPASASAGSRDLVPITLPSATATNTKASHPKIAVLRWAALQRPMRAARFWDLARGVMASRPLVSGCAAPGSHRRSWIGMRPPCVWRCG